LGVETLANSVVSGADTRAEVTGFFARLLAVADCREVGDLIRAMSVSLEDKERDGDSAGIGIMTMHQAKGLTRGCVFVLGAEQEYTPGNARGEDADDERRLLYVSVTRARHFLYITHCLERVGVQRFTGASPGQVGRHLTEFLRGGPFLSQPGSAYVRS